MVPPSQGDNSGVETDGPKIGPAPNDARLFRLCSDAPSERALEPAKTNIKKIIIKFGQIL